MYSAKYLNLKKKTYCVDCSKDTPKTRNMDKETEKGRVYLASDYGICDHRNCRFVKFSLTMPDNWTILG